jgi:cysteine desulfurase
LESDHAGVTRRVTSTNWASSNDAPKIVSVMMANNETGAVQDITQIAQAAKAIGALMHTDAVQALGKLPINFRQLNTAGVSAMTLSAHKIGGPKGAGALVLDKRVDLQAQIAGGGHERGLRSGTENVAAIVGFGLAAEYAASELADRKSACASLCRRLEAGLKGLGATIFSEDAVRLSNTSYFAFDHVDGETLVAKLDRAGFAVASGAACSSANPEPSAVLLAMNVPSELARGAVRVSFGQGNTLMQVDDFLRALTATLDELRDLAAVVH